jgi:integrase
MPSIKEKKKLFERDSLALYGAGGEPLGEPPVPPLDLEASRSRLTEQRVEQAVEQGRLRATVKELAEVERRGLLEALLGELEGERELPEELKTGEYLCALRSELIQAGRNASTVNHYRRIARGAFGTRAGSPALAWEWMSAKVESEGKLRFYDPAQLVRLKAHAHSSVDVAIYTLAAEAGPRLSEISALKVRNVDFANGLLRFETDTRGGAVTPATRAAGSGLCR